MPRHTSFRFCLDLSLEQERVLSHHVGAARFAFNQALRLHKDALEEVRSSQPLGSDPDEGRAGHGRLSADVRVPWTGFDLINAFNAWKRSEAAGRRFVVDTTGQIRVQVTGLPWRNQVSSQVFEEAVVDLGRGLKAVTDSRIGARKGPKVGFPRFKKKSPTGGSFRIRNKAGGRTAIRVGDGGRARSVTLPKIGVLRVRECTRRLRRMICTGRARILNVTVSQGVNRWSISVTVEAADLHPNLRHALQPPAEAPAPRLRRLSKAVSRKKKGSKSRKKAVVRLGRQHARVRDRRRHVLHQVSNQLVKNRARLVLEDLNITGMTKNRKLSRAIDDAAWGELARQITYKQAWHGGRVVLADRWFPSSKTCSSCGTLRKELALKDRMFECQSCGHVMDRDLNAAVNLAAWAENHTSTTPADTVADGGGRGVARVGDRQAAGPVKKAHRQDTPPAPALVAVAARELDDVGTKPQAPPAA
jgi:putative transposase